MRVGALPADGEANRALIDLLARELLVGRRSVAIEAGASSRRKRIRVDGVRAATLAGRWPGVDATDVR